MYQKPTYPRSSQQCKHIPQSSLSIEQVHVHHNVQLLQVLLHAQLSGPGFAGLRMLVRIAAVTVNNILELAWVSLDTHSHEESSVYTLWYIKVQHTPMQIMFADQLSGHTLTVLS